MSKRSVKQVAGELPWGLIGFFLAVLVVGAIAVALAIYDPVPTPAPRVYSTAGFGGEGSTSLSLYDR